MRFSEYLRTLDEGNYGHEYGQESDAHEEALRANREHAAAKRAESTMAPKPPVEPDPKVGDNLKKIAAAKPAETADDNAKRKEWRDSLRSTGDDGGAKAARENTVKEPNGETMLDPKTGKPFPKTGPLKDWQIPSLKEAYTPPEGWRELTDAEKENSRNVTADMARMKAGKEQMKYAEKKRQRAQDKRTALIKKEEAAAAAKKPLTDWQIPSLKEGSRFNNRPTGNEGPERPAGPNPSEGEDKPDKPVDTERWDGHGDPPEGYEDAGGEIGSDGTAELRKKTVKKESLEIPMRDSLGRLSIYSMTEVRGNEQATKDRIAKFTGKAITKKARSRVNVVDNDDGSFTHSLKKPEEVVEKPRANGKDGVVPAKTRKEIFNQRARIHKQLNLNDKFNKTSHVPHQPAYEEGEKEARDEATAPPKRVNDSLEIPMRDALGRLSIYSMTESSTPKPLRKALKKAKMGKKLSNKESGNVMNNPKADGSTRTNAAENYKNPQDDIDANDAAEGERRGNAVGMDRQRHLDEDVDVDDYAPYGSKEEIASRGETNEMTPEEVAKLKARRLTPQQRKEADDVHSGRVKEFPPNDPRFAAKAQAFARAKRAGRAHGTSSGPPSGGVNSTH